MRADGRRRQAPVRLGPERVERVLIPRRSARARASVSRIAWRDEKRMSSLLGEQAKIAWRRRPRRRCRRASPSVRVEVCEFVAHDHEAARSSRESGVDGEQRRERFELRRCGAVIQRPPRVHAQLGLQVSLGDERCDHDQASISQAELVVGPGVRRRLDRLLSESVPQRRQTSQGPPRYTEGRQTSARDVQNGPFWADWDGTVMEQSGRNGWQTFGYPKGRKWLDLAPNRCHRLRPVAVWIAW